MGFVVKNTTKYHLLDLLCPHTCRGCGALGSVLCERCKNNMLMHRDHICPICKQTIAKPSKHVQNASSTSKSSPTPLPSGICPNCSSVFTDLWAFGWRKSPLKNLINDYKYHSIRAITPTLTKLYNATIPPSFGQNQTVIIVPLPTIGKHVRTRGFDHTLTLAKHLAHLRGWQCQTLLSRAVDTVQVGTKAKDRTAQAAKAYALTGLINPNAIYLLLDDVYTTGASLNSAAKLFRDAGIKHLYGTVLAVSQPKSTA